MIYEAFGAFVNMMIPVCDVPDDGPDVRLATADAIDEIDELVNWQLERGKRDMR